MRDTLPADGIHGLSVCQVGIHGLSPLSDRTLLEVAEMPEVIPAETKVVPR